MSTFHQLLVATDFQEASQRAVDLAVRLAKEQGAALTLLHVFEIPAWAYGAVDTAADLFTPLQDAATEMLAKELARIRETLPEAKSMLRSGRAAEETLAAATSVGADLLITGTHGRGVVGRVVLGSVAASLVRSSPVPVLTVRVPD